jgi:ferredoxin-NADP reductase
MVGEVLSRFPVLPLCYVCGPTAMVEQAATLLVAAGLPAATIRTERFGPG